MRLTRMGGAAPSTPIDAGTGSGVSRGGASLRTGDAAIVLAVSQLAVR